MEQKRKCFVCEYGWIIVGKENGDNGDSTYVADASVVRRWSNGKGIGGIAKEANKDEYTLDAIGNVIIKNSKILFAIQCEW